MHYCVYVFIKLYEPDVNIFQAFILIKLSLKPLSHILTDYELHVYYKSCLSFEVVLADLHVWVDTIWHAFTEWHLYWRHRCATGRRCVKLERIPLEPIRKKACRIACDQNIIQHYTLFTQKINHGNNLCLTIDVM